MSRPGTFSSGNAEDILEFMDTIDEVRPTTASASTVTVRLSGRHFRVPSPTKKGP